MRKFLKSRLMKAHYAGAVAAIAFATPVVDDGLVPSEVLGIVGAFVVAWGGTWWLGPDVVEQ